MGYRNHEGYSDPTAGAAVAQAMKEYRRARRRLFAARNRMKVYVASRYAGDVEANERAAVGYCRKVVEEGHMPVAAHLLYPRILNDGDPAERELGLMFGLALLRDCDEVWAFGEVSPGMRREIEEARRLGKPVRRFGG